VRARQSAIGGDRIEGPLRRRDPQVVVRTAHARNKPCGA
jgi:hypothetical protein